VRQGFRDIADAAPERCAVIQADGPVAQVHETIMRTLRARLALPGVAPP
jgi:thymidylate kinase